MYKYYLTVLLIIATVCMASAAPFAEQLKAAEQGNPLAQVSIGIAYVTGRGVAQDYAQAAAWFRKAAEQGNATGQCSLALAYTNGQGVARDEAEAFKWLSLAAEQGNAMGQASLGVMYELGRGVLKDLVQAHKWYSIAAFLCSPSQKECMDMSIASRDRVAAIMTPSQAAEARRLAREWLATHQ